MFYAGHVELSESVFKYVYGSLNLEKKVYEKVVKAHLCTLCHGLHYGTERAIGIDKTTGAIETDEAGSQDTVTINVRADYDRKMIVIHNHPENTPFSLLDIYTFGKMKFIQCLSIQCHNGTIYTIIKTSDTIFYHTENSLLTIWEGVKASDKHKTHIAKGEHFVSLIAKAMGWIFKKGEK